MSFTPAVPPLFYCQKPLAAIRVPWKNLTKTFRCVDFESEEVLVLRAAQGAGAESLRSLPLQVGMGDACR